MIGGRWTVGGLVTGGLGSEIEIRRRIACRYFNMLGEFEIKTGLTLPYFNGVESAKVRKNTTKTTDTKPFSRSQASVATLSVPNKTHCVCAKNRVKYTSSNGNCSTYRMMTL